ncbi:MAG: zf-TFIIB domain-containing protein [Leucobacter sp.]
MNCPTDGTTLLMSERQGVEIDYCPECRGVWLDRGELDKILERAQTEFEAYAAPSQQAAPPQQAEPPVQPAQPAPAAQQPRYEEPRYEQPRYDDRRRDSYYDDRDRDRRYGDPRYGDPRYDRKKKKKPFDFLGDIFD